MTMEIMPNYCLGTSETTFGYPYLVLLGNFPVIKNTKLYMDDPNEGVWESSENGIGASMAVG
jgi:hypothetical protein